MAILYIRDVDENTMAVLKEQARKMNTNATELGRRILNRYAANPELLSIDDKYRSFTEDLMALYQFNMDELKHLVEKNVELAERNEALLHKLEGMVNE